MKKHFLKYIQRAEDWSDLNSAATKAARISTMNKFLKDPNLGLQNFKFKVCDVEKIKKTTYRITLRGSRNALINIIAQWGFGQHYKLNNKKKIS